MKGVQPTVVKASDVPESELWVHDVKSLNAARLLADLFFPDYPVPVGTLLDIEAPIYEDTILEQEQRAISERGPGDIAKLLTSGDTWKIE
jgi:2-oxoglutarate ferredoxin oxidoreductase subunit beta